MNSVKQMLLFTCEACHIAWQVYHSLSEPYYCDECGAVLYRPSVVKEHVFQQMVKPAKEMNFK
jgi:ribosomal protein S27E